MLCWKQMILLVDGEDFLLQPLFSLIISGFPPSFWAIILIFVPGENAFLFCPEAGNPGASCKHVGLWKQETQHPESLGDTAQWHQMPNGDHRAQWELCSLSSCSQRTRTTCHESGNLTTGKNARHCNTLLEKNVYWILSWIIVSWELCLCRVFSNDSCEGVWMVQGKFRKCFLSGVLCFGGRVSRSSCVSVLVPKWLGVVSVLTCKCKNSQAVVLSCVCFHPRAGDLFGCMAEVQESTLQWKFWPTCGQ